MRVRSGLRGTTGVVVALACLVAGPGLGALTTEREAARFDHLVRHRDGGAIATRAVAIADLGPSDDLRRGWERFGASRGGPWKSWVDERSGLPTLALGREAGWLPPASVTALDRSSTLANLAGRARALIAGEPEILGGWNGELVVDDEASGAIGTRVWQLTLRQVVGGVPVDGARFDLHVSSGNLVSFGATSLARVEVPTSPALTREQARAEVDRYLETNDVEIEELEPGSLHLVPVDSRGLNAVAWDGARGGGYGHRLVWRFRLAVPGEFAEWVAEVDAHSGEIFAFFDDARYERIKGGVNPRANDGVCATGGCHEADFPMPFLDYREDGGAVQFTEDQGVYTCSIIGSDVETTLVGRYVRILDDCGAALEATTCENELDLGVGAGLDCLVSPGDSPGNTRAGRNSMYHLNLSKQRGRTWLPSRTWLHGLLTSRVNINSTCNAVWSGGRVNMFRSGDGCNNTGDSPTIVAHEWGHGLDQNDGGGFDNTSEGYADIVGFLHTRESCIGRGFRQSGAQCSNYGDNCLDCNGIRELDWDKREDHTPATPSGFIQDNCPGGGGPCGREEHCEGILAAEALWDLANRDLPAAGLDTASAWQLTERLWFQSRLGSGGNAYNCSGGNADSCGATSWYHKLRLADDDDGNLANGTPHAGAIFAAFDRHEFACGNTGSLENLSTSSCPALAQPVIGSTAGSSNSVGLQWSPVANADAYRILRGDLDCDSAQVVAGEVLDPATSFLDEDLINGRTVHYRLQAIGANAACESPLSACAQAEPQPLAGAVRFDQATYGCSNRVGLQVKDANIVGPTVAVEVRSDSETTPETVVLTAIGPGSATYLGEIFTTGAPAGADGLLSILGGDGMTVEYVDADDGLGGVNLVREHTAVADCVFPVISGVQIANLTDSSVNITWTTNEQADTVVLWDPASPPGTTAVGDPRTTSHVVPLTGLQSCTDHFFEVRSTDPAGNTAIADNGGVFFQFETLGDLGNGVQECHRGRVVIDQPTPGCAQTVTFDLSDIDLNQNPLVAETVVVAVASTTETSPESVLLTETGPDTSRFAGSIATAPGAPAADGVLQSSHGDVMTVAYEDRDDGTGAAAIGFDTSVLDCDGPVITDLRVETHTDARVHVRWTTQEPSSSVVEWGPTAALGQAESSTALVTDHLVALNQFSACQEAHFRVAGTDAFGNSVMVDNGGSPFLTRTYQIPGLYWKESFEAGAAGWTLGGEWQIGAPAGNGGSSGLADPDEAYNNANVLGHDLTGLGAFPGDYEPNVTQTAISPTRNASTWSNTKLIVHRRLNSGTDDQGRMTLNFGQFGSLQLITTGGVETAASDYQVDSFDVSANVDGQSSVSLRFTQISDGSGQFSGWNVDDLIFKDGALPDYGACGGCDTAPAFAGVVSAVDNDACGANGVTVSWNRALSWGTGTAGVYHVHRGTTPGFTPSSSNLIAADLTALSHNDTTAPTNQTVYYKVVAENDESCGGGPNAPGLTAGEPVVVAVQETTSVPVPAEVPGLLGNRIADAHVRFDWDATAGAVAYRVYRSTSPLPGTFAPIGETASPLFEDLGEAATPDSYYYKVIAINACDQEGP